MKHLSYLTIAAALFALVLAVKPIAAQDPTVVDANHYKVEFENASVRVLRVHYGAKEKSVMHAHPDAVAVSLGEMRGAFTLASGKKEMRSFKAGQVRWTPAETHLPENLNGKPFDVILVELKEGAGAGSLPSNDAVKVDPKHHKVEFENDRVRVLRSHGDPNEKSDMHSHPANVVIPLTDINMTSISGDEKTSDVKMKSGQPVWRDALSHKTQNGKQAFDVIIVELKGK
jgi:quercetin dioxygenase-like cupin family protein